MYYSNWYHSNAEEGCCQGSPDLIVLEYLEWKFGNVSMITKQRQQHVVEVFNYCHVILPLDSANVVHLVRISGPFHILITNVFFFTHFLDQFAENEVSVLFVGCRSGSESVHPAACRRTFFRVSSLHIASQTVVIKERRNGTLSDR